MRSFGAVPQLQFEDNDIPIINNEWVLRNDSDYLLLYKMSSSESKNIVLNPLPAIVVSLINGKTSFIELCKEVQFVFGMPTLEAAIHFVSIVIQNLNKESHLVTKKTLSNHINMFETDDYFIPLDRYRMPANGRLKRPSHVRLVTTNKCQTNCIYCYAERSSNLYNCLEYDQWISIIDSCIANYIYNIEISGGDSFADDISMKLIIYLVKSKIPVFISTKSFISKGHLLSLIRAGFLRQNRRVNNIIQISIDSCNETIASFLTGCKDYLARADSNIKTCKELGITPKVKCVLTSYNFREILPLIEKYSGVGITNFQFVYYGLSYFRPNRELLLSSENKIYIHEIKNRLMENKSDELTITIQDDYNDLINFPLTKVQKTESWNNRARCSGGYSSMTILPDGAVTLCEQMPKHEDFIVGDISNKSIDDVWNSDGLVAWLFPLREKFSDSVCYRCDDFYTCVHNSGWCYRDSLFAYDTIYEAPPRCPKQVKPGRVLV
jgi:radical SAM protein with 4Fe4S-binding SPASM domain